MNLATSRRIRNRGARNALIAGVVAWLSFLVQPCVMAAPLAGGSGQERVQPAAVTNHGSGAPSDKCPHCVDYPSTGELVPAPCDDAQVTSQSPGTNSLDSGENGWTPALPFSILTNIQRTALLSAVMSEAELLQQTVSLTLAFCVFLE